EALETIEQAGIGADQNARLVAFDAVEDYPGGTLAAGARQSVEVAGGPRGVLAAVDASIEARGPRDIGSDTARVDTTDGDAPGADFLAQRFGKAPYGKLAGVVSGLGWLADDAENAGNIDDMSAALLQ